MQVASLRRLAKAPRARIFSSQVGEVKHLEQHLLAWEHLLTEEETAAREAVRAWVQTSFKPSLMEAHRQGTSPSRLVSELAGLGVFGATLKGYGCAGLSSVAEGLMMQELERGDSRLRALCSAQSSMVMHAILRCGSDQQRDRFLPELAQGKLLGCFGLLEPHGVGDPAGVSAKRDGSGFILNGVKSWVTNAAAADLAVVWAMVDGEKEAGKARGFLVERGAPGLDLPETDGGAGAAGEIVMSDCRVPAGKLLEQSEGLSAPLLCLRQAREMTAWGVTGAALECFQAALEYGSTRTAFGRPMTQLQLFQQKLAEAVGLIVTSQLMSLHFGRLKDMDQLSHLQVHLHKRNNVAAARKVAAVIRPLLGADAASSALPVMRHLVNIELAGIAEGTDDAHDVAVGQALTGQTAFY